jgi:uncharacterized protein DUF4062
MPQQLTRLTVFISCPSDLTAEKKIIASAIQELNPLLEDSHNVTLNVIAWETDVVPGLGIDAQSVINAQVSGKYDIYIGLLGSRFGTKTPRAESGTQEEFDIAYERYRNFPDTIRVLFYFKTTTAENIYRVDLSQLHRVIDFRKKLGDAGALYFDFPSADVLLKMIRDHLRQLITEQWAGSKWKVLSPLSADHSNSNAVSSSDLPDRTNLFDQESDEDSSSAGFLDLIVTADSALAVAMQALINIGSFTERSTEELKSTTQQLKIAGEQKNARNIKAVMDRLGGIILKQSSHLSREIAVLEDSFTKGLNATETALKMYSEEKLGDPSQLKGLAEALTPLLVTLRGSRQMADEMQETMGNFPGYTRDFKVAVRQSRQVYAGMSAAMTVLLGRTLTAQESFVRLTTAKDSATQPGTTPMSDFPSK